MHQLFVKGNTGRVIPSILSLIGKEGALKLEYFEAILVGGKREHNDGTFLLNHSLLLLFCSTSFFMLYNNSCFTIQHTLSKVLQCNWQVSL